MKIHIPTIDKVPKGNWTLRKPWLDLLSQPSDWIGIVYVESTGTYYHIRFDSVWYLGYLYNHTPS